MKLKHKIVFLDIDGVLNNDVTIEKYGPEQFDPDNVTQLNDFLKKTGAWIIISSAWKHGYSLEQLRKIFDDNGVHGFVHSCTPSIYNRPRQFEIDAWFYNHEFDPYGDCIQFVIIDDNPLNSQDWTDWFDKYFVLTDNQFGFTKETGKLAKQILENC